MNRTRHQLLAGAGLALDEHHGRRRRNPLHHRAHVGDGGARADDAFDAVRLAFTFEQKVLAHHAAPLQAAPHRRHHLLDAKGLEQKVRCAAAKRGYRGFQIRVGGHDDDIGGDFLIAQRLEPLHARLAGQANIDDEQIEVVAPAQLLRRLDAVGRFHQRAFLLQRFEQEIAHARLVIHHQHRRRASRRRHLIAQRLRPAGDTGDTGHTASTRCCADGPDQQPVPPLPAERKK